MSIPNSSEIKGIFRSLRDRNPLIHCITNYVTVNDCANILLACGASPVMADDSAEVEEITALSQALYLNIGTLNQRTITAMLLAGKTANRLNRPILLDPVGAGASKLRTETALKLIEQLSPDVIRGNLSEIKALAGFEMATRGVDADLSDFCIASRLPAIVKMAKSLSHRWKSIVCITGPIDVIACLEKGYLIYNGCDMMPKVTGTGCMLSAMTTAYLAANKNVIMDAMLVALCAMGVSGEIAQERMKQKDGNASFRNYLIDAVCNLTETQLIRRAKYESA